MNKPPPPRRLQGPASLGSQLHLVLPLASHLLWLPGRPASHMLMPLLFCELVGTPPPYGRLSPRSQQASSFTYSTRPLLTPVSHRPSPQPPAFLTPPPCSGFSVSLSPSNMLYNLPIMCVAYLSPSTGMYTREGGSFFLLYSLVIS